MGNSSFLLVKRPGRGVDHPPSSCAEVKETVAGYRVNFMTLLNITEYRRPHVRHFVAKGLKEDVS
jgi:hypothetical protein